MSDLYLLILGILAVNVPFGFWREGLPKFSFAWFTAVHAPVPLVVSMRILLGIDWSLAIFPALTGAYFIGQYLGGHLRRRWRRRRTAWPETSPTAGTTPLPKP